MNPDLLEDTFKKAKEITLDEEKKRAINEQILLFMKNNPLQSQPKKPWFARIISNTTFQSKGVRIALASFAILLVVGLAGGVTSVQADSSLPGDFLYPMKVGFNEKIIEALAFTDKAKINVDIKLMDRRLQETEKLLVENKISDSAAADLNVKFQAQADKALAGIEKLNEEKTYDSAIELGSSLQASLKTHDRVLRSLQGDKSKKSLDPLLDGVTKKVQDISNAQNKTQESIINTIGVDDKKDEGQTQDSLKSAQKSILNARKIIKSKKSALDQKEVFEVESNLDIAENKINEGRANVNSKSYGKALSNFHDANNVAKETQKLIKVKNDLKVDFDLQVDSDDSSHWQDNKYNNNWNSNDKNNSDIIK